jgi:hypothetical protein
VTERDREDRFIERCKKDFGALTYESELLLRYGYSAGASELGQIAYVEGVEAQRDRVLDALGAASQKQQGLP